MEGFVGDGSGSVGVGEGVDSDWRLEFLVDEPRNFTESKEKLEGEELQRAKWK